MVPDGCTLHQPDSVGVDVSQITSSFSSGCHGVEGWRDRVERKGRYWSPVPVNVGHLCEQQGLTACLPFFLLVGKGPVIVCFLNGSWVDAASSVCPCGRCQFSFLFLKL